MSEARIDEAMARIESALARIDAARVANASNKDSGENANPERVMTLINSHEKLREEVADTLRDLDSVIAELDE
ncbi:MAG: hypothetical protein ABJP48_08960 [Erythrobacter sp.]